MKQNEILVIYGKNYTTLARQLLEEAHLAEMIGDREKVIGIKPNLVAPVPAEDGGTTHPEVVEGLIQYSTGTRISKSTDYGGLLGW